MYTGVFFRRYILGLWAMAEGIIYDMFNADDRVTKEEQELYPTGKYISIDYGTQNATVFDVGKIIKWQMVLHKKNIIILEGIKESRKQMQNMQRT